MVDLYQEALSVAPLATKASTSARLFGVGDTIAQFRLTSVSGGGEESSELSSELSSGLAD